MTLDQKIMGYCAFNGPSTTEKQRSRTTRERFGRAKPGTADENRSNNAFHPYGAQGAPRVNADVGIRKMGYSTTNGPSTTVNGKSIDHAATISDRSRA